MADNPPENYDGREGAEPQVWSMEPFRRSRKKTYKHNPCGHWHLPVAVAPEGCLEYVAHIYTNPVSGFNYGTPVIGSDERLYFVLGGTETKSARIDVYEKDFTLYKTETYDMTVGIGVVRRTREYSGCLWILSNRAGYDANWITQIAMSDLSVVSQRIVADCVPGTDGKNYYAKAKSLLWNPAYRPVSGAYWAYVWSELPAGYGYHIYPAYSDCGARCYGSNLTTDFVMDANYFYFAHYGYPQVIEKRNWNMERSAVVSPGCMHFGEICWNDGKTEIAFAGMGLYDYGYCNIYTVRASDMTLLVNESIKGDDWWSGQLDSCLLWHENGYLYNTQSRDSSGSPDSSRVLKIDGSGNTVASYENNGNDDASGGRIVASATNIYWFQNAYGDTRKPGIIKLDLDLNFICFEPYHFKGVDAETNGFYESGEVASPLLIDRKTHMIFSGQALPSGWIVKWDYYA